jgi:FkbM family methyltransferase
MSLKKDIKSKLSVLLKNVYKEVGYNFFDVRKIKALQSDKVNSYPLFGKSIYFKQPSELLHSLSEIFVHEIYKIKLPSKPLIIDCGANIGISVLYFKRRFPESIVIAFEPDQENFEILNLNVNSFQLKNVELNNAAVWVENTYLNFTNDSSMSSKIEPENAVSSSSLVKATRLYDIIDQTIDLLKIDIEGAEYKVLLDIESKLHYVQNMFFEYHGSFSQVHELTNIFTILVKNGFKYYIKEATPVYDHPFIRTEKSPMYDIQLNIFCFRA